MQVLCTRAVCRGEGGQNADRFVLSRLINGCSGTVAEQNAGRAVGVVHDARKRFRRDNQYGFCLAGFNVTVRNVGRGDKAGAGVVDIKRADLTRTQLVLQDRRRIRRVGIRRAGADENEVKLLCGDAASASASCAAPSASSHVCVFFAMRRSRTPVRCTIHSSLVSTIFSSMALVRTKSGMQAPVPISLLLMISTLLKSPNRSPKKRGKATIVRLTKYSPTIIIKDSKLSRQTVII